MKPYPAKPGQPLTAREVEVLSAVARGLTNAEISRELWLSLNTIKTHLRRASVKLGAKSRSQAVHLAHRRITAKEKTR